MLCKQQDLGDFKFPKLEEQRKRWIEALGKCCTTLQNRYNAFICEKHFSNNFFTQKPKPHKYALPSIFLREDKQTSINNVRPAEQI
jgi:hypothetical protein